jgi:prolyl-tRNA synthetase
MNQSQLFTKTQKFAPKDETSKNAQLLIRAGFVHKEMAGVYTFLPLGWRVMNNIMQIIREEMNAIGGQELKMTALQSKEVWSKTNRCDDEVVDNWFKTELKSGTKVGLAFTHEEVITSAMKNYIASYKDLPFSAYQFQTKFRNESRAKSGIMRGREFIMKDLYSFSRTQYEHDEFYEKAKQAYINVFDRLGIGEQTYLTFASGGTFSKYSHEFQTVCDAGEDIIYIDKEKGIAVNEEVYNDEVLADLELDKEKLIKEKAAEAGNIFSLGTKFSDAFDLTYRDKDEKEQKVIMGSYGIGPARAMGIITELLSDENGLIWPENVAPFKVHLINIGEEEKAEEIYNQLQDNGVEVLWDDRDMRPGQKFADADLIGCPYRVVVSSRSLDDGGVELKKRTQKDSEVVSVDDLLKQVK